MPETNTTTVSQDAEGYYRVRIPKALGDAMNLAGSEVEWSIASGQKLELKKVDE